MTPSSHPSQLSEMLNDLLGTTSSRKNTAKKLQHTYNLPLPAASAFSLLVTHTESNPDRQLYAPPELTTDITMPALQEATRPLSDTVELPAIHVAGWWPLVEPNLLQVGRLNAHTNLPQPRSSHDTHDAVTVVEWASPADHAEALQHISHWYADNSGSSRDSDPLYGMLVPFTVTPVRHVYADGSDPVTSFMMVDGTARLFAARRMLPVNMDTALPPDSAWPNDAQSLRRFLTTHGHPSQFLHTMNIVLPTDDDNWWTQVTLWNYQTHNIRNKEDTPVASFTDHDDDVNHCNATNMKANAFWNTIDFFAPQTTEQLGYTDPQLVADDIAEVMDWVSNRHGNTPAARMTLARAALSHDARLNDTAAWHMRVMESAAPANSVLSIDMMWLELNIATVVNVTVGPFTALEKLDLIGVYVDLQSGMFSTSLAQPTGPWGTVGATWALLHAGSIGLFGDDTGWRYGLYADFHQPNDPDDDPSAAFQRFLTELITNHWTIVTAFGEAAATNRKRVPRVWPDGTPAVNDDGEEIFWTAKSLVEFITEQRR